MSSEHNNIKLAIQNDKFEIIYGTCKQCFVTANHDPCLISSVNALNSRANNLCSDVPPSANERRPRTQVWKPKQVGFQERPAWTPKPRLPRFSLKWSPSRRSFDLKGKLVAFKETNCLNDDKACPSNPQQPIRKWFPNSTMFLGRNDHIAAILGYGDLKWGNITIIRVYFVKGLGNILYSVGKFCDADLEVAFRRNTCFIRDLNGVDLLKGNRSTNLYTINLYDMASALPICLMAWATPTKSWLWHQRLSHLKFDTINDLVKNDLVSGLPKFKTKDETPEVTKNFLKNIYVRLQAPVIIVRTDDITEFKIHALKEYFDTVGITHETSSTKTPQQNGVVERRNRTLVEAAKTMLIFSHASLFLWAEQLLLRVTLKINDREDISKLGAKGDIGFFIGYSANLVSYRVYNRRTKKIIETMNVTFDELSAMAFEQNSSKPVTPQRPIEHDLDIRFKPLHNEYLGGQPSEAPRTVPADPQQGNHTPLPNASVADNVLNAVFEGDLFVNPFATPSTESVVSYTQYVDPSNMHTFYQPYPHDYQWTKDHPLEQVIREPSRPVLTRNQLKTEALNDHAWIESMQEELHQFIRLDVWELVPLPDGIKPLTLK
nr:integrase, catalytic region, zinc finger, CCHC-type, peptidase aspartic, catalytic [Tanacetum cinerariifolium]